MAESARTFCGYMVNFEALELGLFLFNHLACRTALAIKASVFTDLYEGPIYEERATGSEACPGYCLVQDELRPCPVRCECSYIRCLLDQIVSWPKEGSDA